MTKHGSIIEELERERANIDQLWAGLGGRQVRVHAAGASEAVVTAEYVDGLKQASNALNKAITALKNVDA
ncbi:MULTISPECIES: hypothetical protein [Bradyrhizobium]|jgi:uncharacterized protein YukE|uniref:Uncharacterized protein YukE n=1 Tax=Bradyrhizobium elkanii TaxID=29448 RepID=A0A8I1Y544_BRAEL|nr:MULTISPECIES: hypothetical protein [Bradyrhizobium]MBP1293593.1 uncharacterized protein YukE [Bradyrhizobium elkanii]MCP1925823.1 uncharacterized protein YukE [Bradyrhizobium elkanii]MCP1927414.1 uncharacterized protein YukE [Bradyrhizobium elkanii]MCS3451457.1 uncharacterized protein YukE [Bradyrhizobium elkanii]MCS3475070.1 uncharacterized protein YukE [Bradyrhizobium elkanii]